MNESDGDGARLRLRVPESADGRGDPLVARASRELDQLDPETRAALAWFGAVLAGSTQPLCRSGLAPQGSPHDSTRALSGHRVDASEVRALLAARDESIAHLAREVARAEASPSPLPADSSGVNAAVNTRRQDFRFFERQRVRWVEVDMQRVVFNGHYLMYFDNAAAGYWRAMGLPYVETMERLGGDFLVRKATVEYAGPAYYDDVLEIGVRCARFGNSSMQFEAAVFRGEELLVRGELVYVYIDTQTKQPKAVPRELRDAMESFEAREAPVTISDES